MDLKTNLAGSPASVRSRRNGPAALRLVGYLRVSSTEQAREGYGLDAQRAQVARWAASHGHAIVAWVEDAGVSGSVPPHKRAGFRTGYALCESRGADGFVAVEQSRFCRNLRAWLALRDLCDKRGHRLACVDTGIASTKGNTTPEETLNEHLRAMFAEYWRNLVAHKTREALAVIRRTEDRSVTGRVRFGFRTATSHLNPARQGWVSKGDRSPVLPHPVEQRMLEKMLALRSDGHGARRIARVMGVNPRTGKPFKVRAVERILATSERLGAQRAVEDAAAL